MEDVLRSALRVNRCLMVGLMVGVAASAACTTTSAPPAFVVRDSAGVRIVENVGNAALPSWYLSDHPTVSIGVVDGADPYLLSRVAAAYRMQDGRIVVANGGIAEFRFFDASGVFLSAAGGKGNGPGELRVLFELTRLEGDTLVAVDPILGRLDWFSGAGDFIKRTRFELRGLFAPPYRSEGAHYLPDHTMLLRVHENRSIVHGEIVRSRLGMIRYHPDNQAQDTVGWYGGLENFAIEVGGRTVPGMAPYTRRTFETWSDDHIFVVDTDRYEIHAFALETGLLTLVRRDKTAVLATSEDRAVFEAMYRSSMERTPWHAETERWLAAAPFRDTKPFIEQLAADRDGRLWVRETPARPDDAPTWAVFDDGYLVAELTMPNRFVPLDIGHDYVLGVWRDEDDVEHVVMYDLVKSDV